MNSLNHSIKFERSQVESNLTKQSIEHNVECNPLVSVFKGNEKYIDELVRKLSSICYRNQPIESTTQTICRNTPLPPTSHNMRKIVLFLLLNTDVTLKYDLSEEPSISHFLNIMAALPKCVMHKLIWDLKIEAYFGEIIAFSPSWFAYPFLVEIADSLRFSDPFRIMDRVCAVVRAIYTSIARAIFRPANPTEHKIMFNKLFDIVVELMQYFYTANFPKDSEWPKEKFHKYLGYVLLNSLQLVEYCFKLYMTRPLLKSDKPVYEVFEFLRAREALVDDGNTTYTEDILNAFDRINVLLLNSLQDIVMQIDCYAFMDWLEEKCGSETLQKVIGESAYHVQKLILENECFSHAVGEQLKGISIKPKTVQEIIQASTMSGLLEILDEITSQGLIDDARLQPCLDSFINRGELTLNNEECIGSLKFHVQSLTMEQAKRMITVAMDIDGAHETVIDPFVEVIIMALDYKTESEVLELTVHSLRDRTTTECFQVMDYESLLISVFNKSTFNANRKDYLKLMFQSPYTFYGKCFSDAISSESLMQQTFEILKYTSAVFECCAPYMARTLMSERLLPPEQKKQLSKLASFIFFSTNLNQKEFIVEILYKEFLTMAMRDKDYDRINIIITILLEISHKFKFEDMCPPLLIVFAQLLELCRWSLSTYTEELKEIVEKTINLIAAVLDIYMVKPVEKEIQWIAKRISGFKKLTLFYYQKMDHTLPVKPDEFPAFLWENRVESNDPVAIKRFLCEHLVQCTSNEIRLLYKRPLLKQYFWEVIKMIAAIVSRSMCGYGINCLNYITKAFLTVVKVS